MPLFALTGTRLRESRLAQGLRQAAIAEAIRFLLSRDGWEVAHEGDGLAALAAVKREKPDLVILDRGTEGLGGLAMLAFLAGFSSTTSMVIVAALALIIEKFVRLTDDASAGGAGAGHLQRGDRQFAGGDPVSAGAKGGGLSRHPATDALKIRVRRAEINALVSGLRPCWPDMARGNR